MSIKIKITRVMIDGIRPIAGWLLSAIASAIFLYAAFLKLASNAMEIAGFTLFGLPIWFMYLVGIAEVTGVALLLLTKQRLAGAWILSVVGLGAAFELATHAQLGMAPVPLVLAAFALGGARLRSASGSIRASEDRILRGDPSSVSFR
jgi:uncharacterized membrane protein YphA (DoxX/SURF4 family)